MFLGVRQFFNPLWLALHNVSQWIQLFQLHFMISFDEISSLRAKFQQLESEAEENKISLKEAATLAKDLKQEVTSPLAADGPRNATPISLGLNITTFFFVQFHDSEYILVLNINATPIRRAKIL
ncbi:hypothetical protein P8452_43068 [Trifolium repens]|nr:hypothetical protein P8452_43068 [Trifolium repens]